MCNNYKEEEEEEDEDTDCTETEKGFPAEPTAKANTPLLNFN